MTARVRAVAVGSGQKREGPLEEKSAPSAERRGSKCQDLFALLLDNGGAAIEKGKDEKGILRDHVRLCPRPSGGAYGTYKLTVPIRTWATRTWDRAGNPDMLPLNLDQWAPGSVWFKQAFNSPLACVPTQTGLDTRTCPTLGLAPFATAFIRSTAWCIRTCKAGSHYLRGPTQVSG